MAEPKFIQIAAAQSEDEQRVDYGIYALDEAGDVWFYSFDLNLWKPLSPKRQKREE